MKDFQLRADAILMLRNDPVQTLAQLTAGKKVLLVYGGGSIKRNGCYDDISQAVKLGGGTLYEFSGASKEIVDVYKGIELVKENDIDLLIGAGGASIMDMTKAIAFGACNENLWDDYIKGSKSAMGLPRKQLILMPTYPSSGSENGLGAIIADSRINDHGSLGGVYADWGILVPKYSLSLSQELTAYTGTVTIAQLTAAVLGDENPMSYAMGVAALKTVVEASKILRENPNDLDARGTVSYGAALSTSGRFGLGKKEYYGYDIYDLEEIPEVLFGATYRKSLTAVYPGFLRYLHNHYPRIISKFIADVFGFEGDITETTDKITELFSWLGADMYFDGEITPRDILNVGIKITMTDEEIVQAIMSCMKK